MPENSTHSPEGRPRLFLWLTDDVSAHGNVLNYVKEKLGNGNEVLELRTESAVEDLTSRTLLGFVLDTLRRFSRFTSWRTTALSVNEHYQALQLCTARVNYNTRAEFSATAVEVICAHNKYIRHLDDATNTDEIFVQEYVSFLDHSNAVNQWDVLRKFKETVEAYDVVRNFVRDRNYLIYGPRRTNYIKECLKVFLGDDTLQQIHVEVPLDMSLDENAKDAKIDVYSEEIAIDTLADANEPVTSELPSSRTGEYLVCVINAIIRVLLNSRDELALATTMASPLVQLPHDAFTQLKRVSLQKSMPMCQCAISYVLRLRLGGNCADDDSPLSQYVCGLADFVDLLHKLQTVIEEEKEDDAVKKVIGIIFARIRNSKGFGLDWNSVLPFKNELLKLATALSSSFDPADKQEGTDIVGKEAMCTLRNISDFMSTRQIYCDLSNLFYFPKHEGTPLNVPAMLAYFKTPDPDLDSVDEEWDRPLSARIEQLKADRKVSAFRTTSNLEVECAEGTGGTADVERKGTECADVTPKRIEKIDEKTNESSKPLQKAEAKTKAVKRSILSEINGVAKKSRQGVKSAKKKVDKSSNQNAITTYFMKR
ncbi:uncharacterized protein LOC135368071 [Ornithodoros turicata]|uniref:uncharacterized protein LOC135368071 n=1 Tax=Ornithodoros turicata TaxID=34597 RepID=UPI0031393154